MNNPNPTTTSTIAYPYQSQSCANHETETMRMIRLIREPKLGVPPIYRPARVMVELTHDWTTDMILECLVQSIRLFYFNLANHSIESARSVLVDRLNAAKTLMHDRIGMATHVSLFLCINHRARRVGQFSPVGANATTTTVPPRDELRLHADARFILTADRRMCQRGCRAAVYANVASSLAHLTAGSVIGIGHHRVTHTNARIASTSNQQQPCNDGSDTNSRSSSPVSRPDTPPPALPTPPVTWLDSANVLLLVKGVTHQSIVCSVQRAGTIRPGDPVHMPIGVYDATITEEERDDIDFASECGAMSIVVPMARNETYARSLRGYIQQRRASHRQAGRDESRRSCNDDTSPFEGDALLMVMADGARLHSRAQVRSISRDYDGVLYKFGANGSRCVAADDCDGDGYKSAPPIVPTELEMELMQSVRRSQKPFLLTCSNRLDDGGMVPMPNHVDESAQADPHSKRSLPPVVILPNFADAYRDQIDYYATGFLLLDLMLDDDQRHSMPEANANIRADAEAERCARINRLLYQFMYDIARHQPRKLATTLRQQTHNPMAVIEDRTRTGRRLLAHAAAMAAFGLKARAIFVITRTGQMAFDLTDWQPPCMVFAIVDASRRRLPVLSLRAGLRSVPFFRAQYKTSDKLTSGNNVDAMYSMESTMPMMTVNNGTTVASSWQREQDEMHLKGIFSAIQRRHIGIEDRVIIVCRSRQTLTGCDTFHTCTVLEFLRRFEETNRNCAYTG